MMIETVNSANYALYCNVLNVSSSPRTGTLEIVDFGGVVVAYGGYNNLAPGGGTGDKNPPFQNVAPFTLAYGKITVDSLPNLIRGNLVLIDANGNTLTS